ncbi:hypothetical protein LCGC14_2351780, partial [marine sediment metagenome]
MQQYKTCYKECVRAKGHCKRKYYEEYELKWNLTKDLKEGDELLIIKDDDRIILKKADKVTEKMKEDLEFARRTGEA